MTLGLRLALAVVRLAARLAPQGWRERVRREWEAELLAEASRGEDHGSLLRIALGAFADARVLRTIGKHARMKEGRESMSGFVAGMIRDARVAVRSLLRAPAYTGVAVVTLGLGLGGSAAIYSLLQHVVLDPLPYPEAGRLVRLENLVPGVEPDTRWNTSTAQFVYFADNSTTLESVGLYVMGGANLQTSAGPERVRTATVTAELLTMLGARAQLGRLTTAEDNQPGAPGVVLLAHGFWTRAFGGDRAIVGRAIQLDGHPFEVVGVLEPGLELMDAPAGFSIDLWRPLTINPSSFMNTHPYRMLGLMAAGADTASVEAELATFTARFPDVYPSVYPPSFLERYGFRTEATPLKDSVLGSVARNLWVVFGGVGLVLMIACANVANLFLVRTEARRRELSVRAALGAGRAQVARYLVAEGLVLAAAGAALALVLSSQAIRAMTKLTFEGLPRIGSIQLGAGTVVFTVVLALIIGVGLAAHPMFVHARAARVSLSEGGRTGSGGPSGTRFRSTLIVTQVAMALVLAVSGGLLVESMRKLTDIDPGVSAEGVLTVQITVTTASYPDDPTLWRLYSRVLERVRALPGVSAAGMSTDLPLQGGYGCWIQGFEETAVMERLRAAGLTTCAGQAPSTPGFFEAMGIPLLSGRLFEDGDNDDPTRAAVIVSRTFADRFWPGEDPIGKRVAPGNRRGYHSVVGVVGDVPAESLEGERAVAIYYPIVLNPETGIDLWPGTIHLAVKSEAEDPTSLLPAIRQAIAQVDAEVPLTNVQAMQDVIDRSLARQSFTALLLGIAAGTALLLAAVGLYGVVSYVVNRRTREIGTRLAVGARSGHVARLVVGQALALAGVGLVIGVTLALGVTRLLEGLLYGVEPTEPKAFAGAAAILLGVTLLASWLPARRAARVDPSEALKSE